MCASTDEFGVLRGVTVLYILLYPQMKVGDIFDSGPSHHRPQKFPSVNDNSETNLYFFFKLCTHVKGAQRKIPILR